MSGRRIPRPGIAVVAVAAFVVLGMPKAAFGVAWPSVSEDLGRDISDLGIAVSALVAGYFVGTLTVGRAMDRLGTGPVLASASVLIAVAVAGYAAAGTWVVLLVAAAALGVWGGWLDAGINAYVALHRGARVMGWIHAGFGVGSSLGPLLMTALLAAGAGWRPAFWAIAGLQVLVIGAVVATRREWDGPAGRPPVREAVVRRPVVYLTLLLFLVYVGLEVAAGQWGFTLLTEGKGLSDPAAGFAVTGFWLAFTGMRVALGIAGDRMPPSGAAGAGAAASVALTLLLWWSPAGWVAPAALVGLGAALGPIFPLQTMLTPLRVGPAATPSMVGYQMAAASVGAILIPGGLSPLVGRYGVGVVAPVLAGAAMALLIVSEAARRRQAR